MLNKLLLYVSLIIKLIFIIKNRFTIRKKNHIKYLILNSTKYLSTVNYLILL